jgi:hypothetical protein
MQDSRRAPVVNASESSDHVFHISRHTVMFIAPITPAFDFEPWDTNIFDLVRLSVEHDHQVVMAALFRLNAYHAIPAAMYPR